MQHFFTTHRFYITTRIWLPAIAYESVELVKGSIANVTFTAAFEFISPRVSQYRAQHEKFPLDYP